MEKNRSAAVDEMETEEVIPAEFGKRKITYEVSVLLLSTVN